MSDIQNHVFSSDKRSQEMDDAIAELGTGGQPILNPVPRQNSGGVMKYHLHKKGTPPFWGYIEFLFKEI